MIGVRLDGRFGNQLSQYAFALAASRKLGTGFVLDDSIAPLRLHPYFRLTPASHLSHLVRGSLGRTARRIHRRISAGTRGHAVVNQDQCLPPCQQPPLGDGRLYVGYFQSSEYFAGFEPEVRERFRLRRGPRERFRAHYGDFFDRHRTVVLHVRRGDYVRWEVPGFGGPGLALPWGYYERCLSLVPDLEEYELVFVTDDPEWVRPRIARWPRARVESVSEIVDFQALAAADVLVLSPSSFSWWAAWLNPKPHKRVFAPARWLGFKVDREYPAGISHPEWELVEVPKDGPSQSP